MLQYDDYLSQVMSSFCLFVVTALPHTIFMTPPIHPLLLPFYPFFLPHISFIPSVILLTFSFKERNSSTWIFPYVYMLKLLFYILQILFYICHKVKKKSLLHINLFYQHCLLFWRHTYASFTKLIFLAETKINSRGTKNKTCNIIPSIIVDKT